MNELVMAEGKWISYLRVSTGRQGRSGLGLEAQRKAVDDFLDGGNWNLVKEFVEVESGKNSDRLVLAEAFKACRLYGAKLVIAKLDRLSRNAHFLLGLKEAGVDFVCADMPSANRLTVGIMAMVAEEEGNDLGAHQGGAGCSEAPRCSAWRLQQEPEDNSKGTQGRPGSQRPEGSTTGRGI
jgi:DNA invertase Pin-like site-specific DNA recombinase